MPNHLDLVTAAKVEVFAHGEAQDSNRFPFLMVLLVAWATRHEGAKLVGKNESQNGYTFRGIRYSHDVIAYPGGWIDCIVQAGPPDNANVPTWFETGTSAATLYSPIDPATVWTPTPGPIPEPVPPDPSPILVRLNDLERRMAAHEAIPPPVCPPLPDYVGTGKLFGVYSFTVRSKPVV